MPSSLIRRGGWYLLELRLLLQHFICQVLQKNDFVDNFKQEVFKALNGIATLDWSIANKSAEYRGAELLRESQLYHGYDNVIEDDKLRTFHQFATIDVCELKAHMELRNEPVRTIFKGFIARVKVRKPFSGATYVQTEKDGSVIDSGSGGLFDSRDDITETELEWGEFERFLKIKSSDPTEARQIFTPDFMAVLYDWWRTHDKPLRLSFREQAIYIGFPTVIDLEPILIGNLDNERPVVRDVLEFMLMLKELIRILVEKQGWE